MPLQRQADSVRALREGLAHDNPEPVEPPEWLDAKSQKQFRKLVKELTDAQVPIKQVDCYGIANAAACLTSLAEWIKLEAKTTTLKDKLKCSAQVARYQRDSQHWLETIAATPAARSRMGLKATPKKTGNISTLLEMKKANAV